MNVGLYSAASAMNVNQKWLEATSENLAGQVVPGFKKQEVMFGSFQAGRTAPVVGADGQLKHGYMNYPITASGTNFTQGPLRRTEVTTDVAIDGKGFFSVEIPGKGEFYTRDGEFHVDPEGQLITKEGYPVIGEDGPLLLDPLSQENLSITADGTLRQGTTLIGKLKVVEFPVSDGLEAVTGGLYRATQASGVPAPAENSRLRQGFLESSNVSVVKEMANMILAMRNYESNQKVLHTQDEQIGKTIQTLGESA